MSASSSIHNKMPPIHVLRGILRRLKVKTDDMAVMAADKHSSLTRNNNTNSATRKYIMEQYRASQFETSPRKIQELRTLAMEYYTLQKDLAERARLHQLDTGAEMQLSPKELSRRAAARAGLQLPKLDPDLE